MSPPPPHDRLVRTLTLASVALGLAPLVDGTRVGRATGVGTGPQERAVLTLVGVRELAAAGLLRGAPRAGLWARVGGDVLDLALLRRSLRTQRPARVARRLPAAALPWRRSGPATGQDRQRAVAVTAVVAGLTAVDLYAAVSRAQRGPSVELTGTTTILRPPAEVHAAWSRFEDLPTVMAHLQEVRRTGARTTHWTASAPFGRSVEWDAETTEDVPGERISWRSLPGARIANAGTVRFRPAPGDRGTELYVTLSYRAPGGALGRALARWAGEEPHQQLDDDLRRFKQVLETGEVVRSDGAPGGKRARSEFPQRPAQPLSPDELSELTEERV